MLVIEILGKVGLELYYKLRHLLYPGTVLQIETSTMSTTEAEYVAASQTVKYLIWLNLLQNELINEKDVTTLILMVDNQSAIKLIKNPGVELSPHP